MNRTVHESGGNAPPRGMPARIFNDMHVWEAGWRSGQRVAFLSCVNRERQGGPKEGMMKRLTNCMTTAAAVLMVTAGVASAQTLLTAEVPFAFHVGGRVMEPGTIHVRLNRGNAAIVTVHNFATKRSYIVLP